MRRNAIVLVLIVLVVMAIDAVTFTRAQARQISEQRPIGLREINAYLDDSEDDSCKVPAKCTKNTIDSTCAKLACKADKKDCDGDYSSGDCKDIKDLHEAGMCELAKDGCGDTLPKDPSPQCPHWWNYGCRLARVYVRVSN
jgi:hypothetical protein